MVEFRWIIFSLFLMLLFDVPAATGQYVSRHGDDVTLPCDIVTDGQDKCDSTTWTFSDSIIFVTLVESGQIHNGAKTKSDRLSVTENCSLVIKKVTAEDAGLYICRQFKSGTLHDSNVHLSLITMTEHKDDDDDDDMVTLNCSVSYYGRCRHTVKWLYEGKHVDEDNKDMKTSKSECSATVTFPANYVKQKSEYHERFMCGVTDRFIKNEMLFTFSRQISGDKTVWWRFIVVSVGLSALLISVVTVNIWTRTKGNKTQTDENMEHNDEDEDEGTVKYENAGEPSASVRLH